MKYIYTYGIAAAAVVIILFVPLVRLPLICYVDDEHDTIPAGGIWKLTSVSLANYTTFLINGERYVTERNFMLPEDEELRSVTRSVVCEPEDKWNENAV